MTTDDARWAVRNIVRHYQLAQGVPEGRIPLPEQLSGHVWDYNPLMMIEQMISDEVHQPTSDSEVLKRALTIWNRLPMFDRMRGVYQEAAYWLGTWQFEKDKLSGRYSRTTPEGMRATEKVA